MANQILNTRIVLKHDTCANWDLALSFVPLAGEIIVYDDWQTITDTATNAQHTIPGIKIGDGITTVGDLSFIDADLRKELIAHINDGSIHVTLEEKNFWNNKLSGYILEETLILTTGEVPTI